MAAGEHGGQCGPRRSALGRVVPIPRGVVGERGEVGEAGGVDVAVAIEKRAGGKLVENQHDQRRGVAEELGPLGRVEGAEQVARFAREEEQPQCEERQQGRVTQPFGDDVDTDDGSEDESDGEDPCGEGDEVAPDVAPDPHTREEGEHGDDGSVGPPPGRFVDPVRGRDQRTGHQRGHERDCDGQEHDLEAPGPGEHEQGRVRTGEREQRLRDREAGQAQHDEWPPGWQAASLGVGFGAHRGWRWNSTRVPPGSSRRSATAKRAPICASMASSV